MEFIVASQLDVEEGIEVEGACAVISIRDPGNPKPKIIIKGRCVGVLYLEFHDAEWVQGVDLPKDIVLMKTWQACQIWGFFEEHRRQIDTMVIHCYAGISRSPAVAAALSEACGERTRRFFVSHQPNTHVYERLLYIQKLRSEMDTFWSEQPVPRDMPIVGPTGEVIRSVDGWFEHAPPEGGLKQWKDGRSAKELARRWFNREIGRIPWELGSLFRSHPATHRAVLIKGMAEHETLLDTFAGKGRQHDLLLDGFASGGSLVIGVEAKADEPFGPTIAERLALVEAAKSNVPRRIANLSQAVFGSDVDGAIGKIRYQLLHAVAATIIEAIRRRADYAVFLVHEFVSTETSAAKQRENKRDLTRFVARLTRRSIKSIDVDSGRLIDCGTVTGCFDFAPQVDGERHKPRLLIGKAQTNVDLPSVVTRRRSARS